MNRAGRNGFTLFEVLVATSLLAAIAGSVVGLLHTARRSQDRLEQRVNLRSIGEGVLERMARDLEGAVATGTALDAGFLGNDGSEDGYDRDTIEFLSLAGRTLLRASESLGCDFRRIDYRIDYEDPEAPRPALLRAEQALLTGFSLLGEGLFETHALAEEVVGLDLAYYDGEAWLSEWDSNVEEGLPGAIHITVEVEIDDPRLEEPVAERFGRVVALRIEREFGEAGR